MNKIRKTEDNLAKGSIYDVAKSRGERPEDILAEADVVVLLDESGSMRGHKHEEAVKNLRMLQQTFPGRVILCSFSSSAKWHFNGLPSNPGGGTAMHLALQMAYDFGQIEGTKVYLISDGQPDVNARQPALDLAEEYKVPINTIFIGSDFDTNGQEFLFKISQISGGVNKRKVDPQDFGETMVKMLTGRNESA